MDIKRWLPTFLAFPLGGFLAMGVVGSLHDPLSGAAGGLLAGAVIGAAQAVALRTNVFRWAGTKAAAMAAGTALAAAITGAGTDLADLMITGLAAGAAVGAAQGTLLAGPRLVGAAWTAITAASWSLAWLVSWAVIGVNADQGFFVFGSSGAIVATILTGLALRALQAPRREVTA
jgi:hypothetical protein